jgi:hypothetical protein
MQVGLAVEAIARSCPRLRVLLFPIAAVQTAAALALAECCPLLEEVGVGGEEVGDEEITALARGCRALWKLVISARGLRAIRYYCGNLKEIELSSAMISEEEFVSDFFPQV